MRAAKKALRAEVRRKMAAMTSEEKSRQSDVIAAKLLSLPQYRSSKRVSVYLSTDDEVQTGAVIRDIFRSGKTCFIPRYHSDGSGRMSMVLARSEEDLERLPLTRWGIRQPPESEVLEDALSTGGLDLVVVPGVAFTPGGSRLGRGKGFYDGYLARCRAAVDASPPPYVVALAFSRQLVEQLPREDLDEPVHLVLHPE